MPYTIIDKIINGALALVITALLAITIVQTSRLHSAQLAKAEAEVALATERREAAAKLAQDQAQVRKTENTLQDSAATTREQIHEATQSIAAERDALLDRVRLAEATRAKLLAAVSRATSAASTPEAGPVDHGTELLGTFGEEDVREAERANLIRASLLGCYRDYETARAALSKLQP